MPGFNQKDAGFTLMELLVVLALLAMIYSIAVPLYGRMMPLVNLNSVAEKMLSDMRQARIKAMASGQAVTLQIKENGRGYVISRLEINEENKSVEITQKKEGRKSITFYPDGKNDGFEIYLRLGNGEKVRERQIVSDWITGRISMVKP